METKNKFRLFWGIEIPDKLKELIFKRELEKINNIKFVSKENIHLTILFLGEISENIFQNYTINLCLLDNIINNPFTISLKSFGVFPDIKFPRVFWVGIEDKKSNLNYIFQKIFNYSKQFLNNEFDSSKNQKFFPHITIARFKQKPDIISLQKIIDKYNNFSFGEFEVKNIVLFQSELTSDGPVYSIVKSINNFASSQ